MSECQDQIPEEMGEFYRDKSTLHVERYDPDGDRDLSVVILEAVAILGERPMEMLRNEPLYDTIEIGAVETLLFGPQQGDVMNTARRTVTFEYSGYLIHIHGDGRILLSDADDTTG